VGTEDVLADVVGAEDVGADVWAMRV